MKPPPFDYQRAASPREAVEILGAHEGARLLAGGQSLVQLMSARVMRPPLLVDIDRLDELAGTETGDGTLEIGALTRSAALEADAGLPAVLREAAARVGHPAIRNRGTLGGNLAHADPRADLPVALLALDAQLVALGGAGERVLAAGELATGAHATSLRGDELLTRVRIPRPPEGTGGAFLEISPRRRGWGLAAVAGVVVLADDGASVREARVALGCVEDVPARMRAAEEAVAGRPAGEETWSAAAETVRGAVTAPRADAHASGEYRRHLAGVLTRRVLALAAERARGGSV